MAEKGKEGEEERPLRYVTLTFDREVTDEEVKRMQSQHGAINAFAPKAVSCHWGGQGYSDGAVITSGGRKYRCNNGTWDDIGPAS